MSQQERNRCLVHEIVGDAAEQSLAQAGMTVSAHDDKVGLSSFCFCDQLGSDLTVLALDAMKDGVDPMMLEMIDGIDTHERFLLGYPLARDEHDRDLIGPV